MARSQEARRWILEVEGGAGALLVSPRLEAADHFIRELASERGSLFGLARASLDSLAYRLALPALAEGGLAIGSRLGQEAVTARVLHQTRLENRLGALESVVNGPGLVRALTTTLHECRHHRVSPEELSRLGDFGATLGWLLARYEEMSKEHAVADRALVLELASKAPVDRPVLFLDVPIDSPLEASLVQAIAGQVPVCATALEGDGRTLEHLRRALGVEPERAGSRPETSAALFDLQRHVFGEETPPLRGETSEVVTLSAPGEAQEACELARAIQKEAEMGVPFDRMAILLRSPELYTPLLEDALRRASIPAHFEDGTKRPDPAGRAFLALLDCAAEELSASRFAEYLSLSQLPRLDAVGARVELPEAAEEDVLWVPPRHALAPQVREPVQLDLFAPPLEKVDEPEKEPVVEGTLRAPWRWEKLLVDAAVIGGRGRWERRLSGLARELELKLLEVEDSESAEAETLRRERNDLLHLRNFALPLIDVLSELPREAVWGSWIDALEHLATEALARPEGVLAILKELQPMASIGPVGLFEVREVLSERLTLLSQRPEENRYGKVWVAPLEAARGTSFEVVLVPGLAERMFPRKIVEDPLLLDRLRRELRDSLPLQKDRIAKERLLLRLAIGAASRKIVFSYPSVDLAKGRAKVPSFYLLEVARASQGELPDFETLSRDAASSSGARLGWPAPRDRMRAIDATEFDLAFLSDSLRRETTEKEARGTGRYLVEVNDSLARSLRARYQRGRYGRFTTVDGFLDGSEAARSVLARHRLEARPYSVTALEKYAACPYRFYLNAVMRLRPRETVEAPTHLDPLTKGHILHDAQFHVSKRLEEADLLPLRPENLDEALQIFEVVFDEVQDRFHEELAPAIERIWKDELERIRFDLRGWLRREAAQDDGFVPYRREFTFGMRPQGPADPASTLELAVLKNGLRLRGAIDLVERREDGRVRITDHKSGKVWMPAGTILNGGQSLQPILYSLAYEALTGEVVESARLYYVTQRAGYAERVVRPDEEALAVVAELQRRLDAVIEEGFFPASPEPELGCRYCDYLPVCGPRMQIDAKRKEQDPRLSPLNWIRNLT